MAYLQEQSTAYAAIETGVDLGMFALLSQDDSPKNASCLAEGTGADPTLMGKYRHEHPRTIGISRLTNKQPAFLNISPPWELSTRPDQMSTPGQAFPRHSQSRDITIPMRACTYLYQYHHLRSLTVYRTGCITAGILALPTYLRQNGYRAPSNGEDCPFQLGFDTDSHFFKFLRDHPSHASQFNNHMSAYHQGRPSRMDAGFYPVSQLAQGLKHEDVLLVDVGGSVGHDLSEFQRKWSDMPGRLVLQDLPDVIEQAQSMLLHPRIEATAHDFFTEQPIKGT